MNDDIVVAKLLLALTVFFVVVMVFWVLGLVWEQIRWLAQ